MSRENEQNLIEPSEQEFEQKDRERVLGMIVYWGWMIALIILLAWLPKVGAHVLLFQGIRGFGLLVLSLIAFIALYRYQKYKKWIQNAEGSEYAREHNYSNMNKTLVAIFVAGVFTLIFGIAECSQFLGDVSQPPEQMTLTSCTVSKHTTHVKAGASTHYFLVGWQNGKQYSFELKGISVSEIENLSRNDGKVEVVFYPSSKRLVSYQYEIDPEKSVSYHTSDKASYLADQAKAREEAVEKQAEHKENVKQDETRDELAYLLQNSNLPDELLNEMESKQELTNTGRLYEQKDAYDSYLGRYPLEDDKTRITKLKLKTTDYSVLGVCVGDRADKLAQIMMDAKYMQEWASMDMGFDSIGDGNQCFIYTDGCVNLFFVCDMQNVIKEIRVIISDGGVLKLDYDL